jgi:hypothetical protein
LLENFLDERSVRADERSMRVDERSVRVEIVSEFAELFNDFISLVRHLSAFGSALTGCVFNHLSKSIDTAELLS